jgi:NAD(P)-dependent dehydrogenase (short-subunit alcohol dehydrogenase family)
MPVEIDLSGQVALVTGGAKGVGRGIADRLVDAGATVVVCGRSERPEDLPAHLGYLTADVREADQAAALVQQVAEQHGRLDVVVNNAGGSPTADAATASPRFSARIVGLNLLAALDVAQAANAVMQDQAGGGSITNITSMSGMRASPGNAAYGAAKAGLVNLTETLAMEWAPKVRVNCVSAGMVRTELFDDYYGGPEGAAEVSATVPMGRPAEPADVGDAVLFLASPLASYVSGANLVVHGGGERLELHRFL